MKIAIVGNNDGPLRLVKSLKSSSVEIVFVGLQKEAPPELKKNYAEKLPKITAFSDGFDEEKLLKILQKHKFDWLINCFCNFKFTDLLKRYEVLNVHLSPLPKYRGRHPLHWALINDEKNFGATIHKMDEHFDAGEIYRQVNVKVPKNASVKELRERLMNALETDFSQFMDALSENKISPKPNLDSEASYIPRRYPADSKLTEWSDPERVVRKVFAMASEDFPAFIQFENEKIEVRYAQILNEKVEGAKAFRILNQTENELKIVTQNERVICFGVKK
jgi:methionyl-tRNA formyltransferase